MEILICDLHLRPPCRNNCIMSRATCKVAVVLTIENGDLQPFSVFKIVSTWSSLDHHAISLHSSRLTCNKLEKKTTSQ